MSMIVAGAGLSGAVVARQLAEAGHKVAVFEGRDHVAGNCFTERDTATGVMVHRYGPHIFHTDDELVWKYVNRFTRMMPYIHRVKSTVAGRVYSLPVNLGTINQFFGKAMSPKEARAFIASLAEPIDCPATFEEQALAFVGRDLYEAFYSGYTRKQWGCDPTELPAAILKRLPLRFDYDDNYFNHRYQGVPEDGYTALVERILDHPNISIHLKEPLAPGSAGFGQHIFWTGPIDAYFGHALGRLAYRTLDFAQSVHEGDYQGCAVMNFGDMSVPYTRVTEHKHFAPWETHTGTVVYHETSRDCGAEDTPYYPVRLVQEKALLGEYVQMAEHVGGVTFLGRLGTYRYLDMDVTIREAISVASESLAALAAGTALPKFSTWPL